MSSGTPSSLIRPNEPDPPRGRWRLVFDADRGFTYSVQPRRQARRVDWPPPAQAWRDFTQWEAARSAAERNSASGFNHARLLRNIQTTDLDDAPERPHVLRVVLAEFVEPLVNPEDRMDEALRGRIVNERTNPLCRSQDLKQAISARERLQRRPSSDQLSRLPPEVLDLILGHAIQVHLDLLTFLDPPPPQRLRHWSYTAAERAVLHGLPRSIWPLVSAIPSFRVSRLMRTMTVAAARRVIKDANMSAVLGFPNKVDGSATVRMDYQDTSPEERETEVLSAGVSVAVDEPLREISPLIAHLVRQMTVEIVWDHSAQQLLSPVKRLIGMESHFLSLQYILIRCRVVNWRQPDNSDDPSSTDRAWQDLASCLYGPLGLYVQVAGQVSRAFAVALWAALARRTGIWPGYCLRPSCTPHNGPCRARPPFMAHRVPILDIDLLPALE